jgi:hypothetical protein
MEIKCCPCHPKPVKLEWTFAFPGAEYWCPYCGYTSGMLGAGPVIDLPFSAAKEMVQYRKNGSMEYLEAKATASCSYLEWEGKRIQPHELPDEEKERLQKIMDDWVYPGQELEEETT